MKIYGNASLQRELWTDEEWGIFEKFHFKCVRCPKSAVTLHEDCPKSKCPDNWREEDNRTPLCNDCHYWAHHYGTKFSRPLLKVLKRERLKEYETRIG